MNLTSKELTAIEDQLSSEATIVKKYRMYAQTCGDSQSRPNASRCIQAPAALRQAFQPARLRWGGSSMMNQNQGMNQRQYGAGQNQAGAQSQFSAKEMLDDALSTRNT